MSENGEREVKRARLIAGMYKLTRELRDNNLKIFEEDPDANATARTVNTCWHDAACLLIAQFESVFETEERGPQ